jgi:hypothetical protein
VRAARSPEEVVAAFAAREKERFAYIHELSTLRIYAGRFRKSLT